MPHAERTTRRHPRRLARPLTAALIAALFGAATCRAAQAQAQAQAQEDPPPFEGVACAAADHPPAWLHNGDEGNDHLGISTASGDWDGDGFDDVLVAGGAQPGSSEVWLYYGQDLGSRLKFEFPDFHNELNRLGPAVAFLGDIDGGGRCDIAIGDPFWTNDQGTPDPGDDVRDAGRVLVWLGENAPASGTTLVLDDHPCSPDIVIEYDGPDAAWFGASLAGGNVANSFANPFAAPPPPLQFADLIVGAPGRQDVAEQFGRVFVFLGGQSLPLAGGCAGGGACAGQATPLRIAASCAFRILTGALPQDRYGFSVAALADLFPPQGDGYAELVIGAPQGEFAMTGPTQFVHAFTDRGGDVLSGYAEVRSLAADWSAPLGHQAGFGKVISLFGWSAASAGDFDGDGLQDIVVGAPGWGEPADAPPVSVPTSAGGTSLEPPRVDAGAVFVYSGALDGSTGAALIAGPITAATLHNGIEQPQRGDLFGYSLAGRAGHDVDGDGRDEIVIGAPVASNPPDPANVCGCGSPDGSTGLQTAGAEGGHVYVVGLRGADDSQHAWAVFRAEAPRDGFGWSVALGAIRLAPPLTSLDVICGAPRNSIACAGGTEEGELDIFSGEALQLP